MKELENEQQIKIKDSFDLFQWNVCLNIILYGITTDEKYKAIVGITGIFLTVSIRILLKFLFYCDLFLVSTYFWITYLVQSTFCNPLLVMAFPNLRHNYMSSAYRIQLDPATFSGHWSI